MAPTRTAVISVCSGPQVWIMAAASRTLLLGLLAVAPAPHRQGHVRSGIIPATSFAAICSLPCEHLNRSLALLLLRLSFQQHPVNTHRDVIGVPVLRQQIR